MEIGCLRVVQTWINLSHHLHTINIVGGLFTVHYKSLQYFMYFGRLGPCTPCSVCIKMMNKLVMAKLGHDSEMRNLCCVF